MKIQIQSLAFPLAAAVLDHTERPLRVALARIRDRIRRVDVRLGDTNDPRGRYRKPTIKAPVMVSADITETACVADTWVSSGPFR